MRSRRSAACRAKSSTTISRASSSSAPAITSGSTPGYYHFAPKPCAPYRGNEKGKVERQIQYLRHSFFAARRFSSVEDLNAQLARWVAEIAHTRRAPGHADGRSVVDLLADEKARLLPLLMMLLALAVWWSLSLLKGFPRFRLPVAACARAASP